MNPLLFAAGCMCLSLAVALIAGAAISGRRSDATVRRFESDGGGERG